jgi:hypothetical protein
MKYEVSKKTIDNIGRNEWHVIKITRTKNIAITYAIAQSKKFLETDCRGFDEDGDICFHAFYKNGKQTIQTL